jgi:hypothetical protein
MSSEQRLWQPTRHQYRPLVTNFTEYRRDQRGGLNMDVDTINARFTVIEKVWKDATATTRTEYLAELGAMTSALAEIAGPQAASAKWLSRRIDRVARYIGSA